MKTIEIEKILDHLDKQVRENREALHWAEEKFHIDSLIEKLSFLQNLRAALTIEETDENH